MGFVSFCFNGGSVILATGNPSYRKAILRKKKNTQEINHPKEFVHFRAEISFRSNLKSENFRAEIRGII